MEPHTTLPAQTRRTRIVCISDTHNCTVKLPKGDVLIHAGDLTNHGSYLELSKAVKWLDSADFEAKVVIAGNHDVTLDQAFFSHHGQRYHTDTQDPSRSISLLTSSRSITYLCHESATIRLADPKGPRTEFKVFGSPYSPRCGLWAFSYDRLEASQVPLRSGPIASGIWRDIPSDIDILVTHTPARTHRDACPVTKLPLGCEELRHTLSRVRPRLHVCGHIHPGRGSERLRWNMSSSDGTWPTVEPWLDPSPDPKSAKISLVDLTARGGKRPLDFGRAPCEPGAPVTASPARVPPPDPMIPADTGTQSWGLSSQDEPGTNSVNPTSGNSLNCKTAGSLTYTAGGIVQDWSVESNTSRRETCVVNCAIVATNWPHTGGKQFNKPIVVDVDLPVWG